MARGGLKPLTPLLFLSKLLLSLNNIHKNVPRDRGLRVSSAFPLPKVFSLSYSILFLGQLGCR